MQSLAKAQFIEFVNINELISIIYIYVPAIAKIFEFNLSMLF